jgi:DNA mismatch repair protein MutL
MTQFPQGFQKVKREISATVTMANSILDIVEPISQTMPHLIPLPKPIINREFNQVNSREALSFIPELKKIENEDIKNSDIQVTEVNHDNKLEQTNQELQTTLVTEQELRLIGVLNHLYIILENKEGLVLMDQHAAHERINFEKMMRMIRHEKTLGQRLLIPLTVQLTPKDADFVMRHLGVLAKTGIEMEPFGLHTFKIETLPFFIKQENPLYWINELIEELAILSTKNNLLRMSEDLVATTVCRKSIKANDRLSVPEIHALIKDLMACEMPYCCPHGRPTLIQMTMLEIEKKFGRKV